MRNIKIYNGLILVLLLASCSNDFIELAPISESNAKNFYQTPDDFKAAIIATYSNLQSENQYGSKDTRFGGSFYALMEVRADIVTDGNASTGSGKVIVDIDKFNDNPLSGKIEGAWTSIFKTIFDANTIITRIENIDIEKSLKNQYLGEARFLRALSYFNAVRLWGDVPLIQTEITPQEAAKLSRNKVSEVYKTIIEADFKFAVQNLPVSFKGEEGRATSGVAKAFLGKVYLTQQKWTEASTILQEVVQSNTYKLLSDVRKVFALDNELNNEIIFSVRFASGQNKVGHLGFGTPQYDGLVTLYNVLDPRLPLLDAMENDNGTYPAKQFEDVDDELGRDFPVLRYADVLLMLAEAMNEIGYQANADAFDYLNQVRNRDKSSSGLEYTNIDLPSQESFRNAVQNERVLELPFELHRWFDLLRTNNAIKVLGNVGITVKDYQLLYPIPQKEINVYNNPSQFPQNSGY